MPDLSPRSAFDGLLPPCIPEAGVNVAERKMPQIVAVTRRGARQALSDRLLEGFGLRLSDGPSVCSGPALDFVATGPDTWLAVAALGGGRLASRLDALIGDLTVLVNQSAAYGVLEIGGPSATEALSRLVPLDLEGSFGPGTAAATFAEHVPTVIWRPAASGFVVAAPRSYARSFWQAFERAGAPFGLGARASPSAG